ncbi:hypothetical protein ELQ90_03110 [Labedella phragmitis]|uniref:Phage tail tape measure protein n=1 Tax=Labedella phragmitis TaxID=2498849 RepID=A0A3S4BLV7_9MICO|nr:hypothetical protein [Labedella phragmitis]RWZ52939.1 hypothetical protein ELQ90_03110 [Labedella phragmitis]
MGRTAILAIRIIGDATSAVTSLERVDGSAGRMQQNLDRAAAGSAVALAGIGAAAMAAGDAASSLEQATGAVDSVFGQYAARVHEYAQTSAADVGLARAEYSQLSAVLGAQLKNMGFSLDEVSGQTNSLIGLGSDLAAMFGGTTSDAVGALSSLLRGERDPIERYGVSIKAADVSARVAAMGLSGLTGDAARAAETQATLALLTEQTAAAQGQFAREADTAAGSQQIANAAFEDAQAKLGEQLLPLMAEGALVLADFAGWISDNSELVTVLAAGIGVLAGGVLLISGAMRVYAAAQAIQTAAQWASNAAWLANPVTWIVLLIVAAIGLLIAIIIVVINNWDELCAAIETGAQAVGDWFASIGRWADDTFGPVINWIREAIDWFGRLIGVSDGWTGGSGGRDSSQLMARSAITTPTADTMLASAARYSATLAAEPMTMTTTAAAMPAPSSIGSSSSSSSSAPAQNVYNITVEGAIDPDAVARQMESVLRRLDRRNGIVAAGGNR